MICGCRGRKHRFTWCNRSLPGLGAHRRLGAPVVRGLGGRLSAHEPLFCVTAAQVP